MRSGPTDAFTGDMNRLVTVGVLLATATSSIARAESASNTASVQVGVMPTLSFLGIEYTRVLLPHVDLAASASIGCWRRYSPSTRPRR